ncbi:MAG TPA: sugar ABC transporter substrate-binding protein [Anaeromyxobacteraceae bacterium]|nr:sugar ABC transporter substrate-binding protein [Anaeromyxobacteraceae bacterium]
MAGLCASACARRDDRALSFWAMGREGEVATRLLGAFERENPGVRVRVEQLPWSAAHEKLLTAFAGDATPDVAQMGNTWLPEFVALDALEPLDASVRASRHVDLADYDPGILDTNVVDGQQYGVPWYVDTRVLFYRRDLLAEAGFTAPPHDWEEWVRMLAGVKRRVGPARYALLLPLNEYAPFVAFWLQMGEPLLRDGGRYGNFRSPGFDRTLRFYLEMYERDLAPPVANSEVANVWNEFARGYFSFYVSGPWQLGEFRRRLPAALQPAWTTAPLPGPTGPGASIAGGASLAIFRRSPRRDTAWKLVEFLSRPQVQRQFHEWTGDLPARRSAWTGALEQDPRARAFREQLERVRPVPKVPEWERIATELRLVVEKVVLGEIPPTSAAAELDARADRILEKRRWMLERRGRA